MKFQLEVHQDIIRRTQ